MPSSKLDKNKKNEPEEGTLEYRVELYHDGTKFTKFISPNLID